VAPFFWSSHLPMERGRARSARCIDAREERIDRGAGACGHLDVRRVTGVERHELRPWHARLGVDGDRKKERIVPLAPDEQHRDVDIAESVAKVERIAGEREHRVERTRRLRSPTSCGQELVPEGKKARLEIARARAQSSVDAEEAPHAGDALRTCSKIKAALQRDGRAQPHRIDEDERRDREASLERELQRDESSERMPDEHDRCVAAPDEPLADRSGEEREPRHAVVRREKRRRSRVPEPRQISGKQEWLENIINQYI